MRRLSSLMNATAYHEHEHDTTMTMTRQMDNARAMIPVSGRHFDLGVFFARTEGPHGAYVRVEKPMSSAMLVN